MKDKCMKMLKKFSLSVLLLSSFLTTHSVLAKKIYDPMSYDPDAAISAPYQDEECSPSKPKATIDYSIADMRHDFETLTKGSPIKSFSKIDMNPIDRTLHLDGVIEFPKSLMVKLDGLTDFTNRTDHQFSIILGFSLYNPSKRISIHVKKFELDKIDYSKGASIIANIVPAILANRSFINYFMDSSKVPTDYSEKDTSAMIKRFLDEKIIEFRNERLHIELNLKNFSKFEWYGNEGNYRVWQSSPVYLEKTKESSAFRIALGCTKYNDDFKNLVRKEYSKGKKEFLAYKENQYLDHEWKNKNIQEFIAVRTQHIIDNIGIQNWTKKETLEIESLKNHVQSRMREALDRKNSYFQDEPERAFARFVKESDDYTKSFMLDLKLNHVLRNEYLSVGRSGNDMPFSIQRFSQNSVNQFTNFFRDFEFDKMQLFPELNVVINPSLPGVSLRGVINMDINTLIELGLSDSGIDFSAQIGFDPDTYKSGLPFEMSLKTEMMKENSTLGLDIQSVFIGKGAHKIRLDPQGDNGDFLVELTKMAAVNILKSFMMSEAADTGEEVDANKLREALFSKIQKYRSKFLNKDQSAESLIDQLIKVKEFDLNNPFNETPAKVAEGKLTAFFKNIIGYDHETGRITVNLTPRNFSEKIFYAKNNIHLWSLTPIFMKDHEKTFFEVAVGDNEVTKSYKNYLQTRDIAIESQTFSSNGGNIHDESKVDYHLKLDLPQFKEMINSILTASLEPHRNQIMDNLDDVEEGSFQMLEDLVITAHEDNVLSLTIKMNQVKKTKNGSFKKFFGKIIGRNYNDFNIENKRSSVEVKIQISAVNANHYKEEILEISPNEVFLGDTFLKVDLLTAGMKQENPGLFGQMMNGLIGEINVTNSSLKKLVLKMIGGVLNPSDEKVNGNTVLGGVHLNKFAKIYTYTGEIFIQLNPRLAGPVWDFYMVSNDKTQSGKDIGINIDHQKQSISFDFTSAFNPSTVDKIKLYEILKEANNLTKSLDDKKLYSDLESLELFNKVFYDSDESLHHKFIQTINQYDALAYLHELKPYRAYEFTSSGAELMHVAASAYALHHLMDKLETMVFNLRNDSYVDQMRELKEELRKKYIEPNMEFYESYFHQNNKTMIKKDITDWNHLVYPDALFAEKIFEYIKP